MDYIAMKEANAALAVCDLTDLPMPESHDMLGIEGEFDPWNLFPALYGSYCSCFDKCAIEVLTEILEGARRREDLGADMLREMLCVADLCSYGTSPRVCFPTSPFREILPILIERWKEYAVIAWGEGWDSD